jgi:chromosome segregation ATPase
MSFQRNEIQNLYHALEVRDQAIAELKGQLELALRTSDHDHFMEQIETLRQENLSYRDMIASLQTQLKDSSYLDRNVRTEINYLRENSKSQDQLVQSQLNSLQKREEELERMKDDHRRLVGEQYSLEIENQRLRDIVLELEKNEEELVREIEHLTNQNIVIDTYRREVEAEKDRFHTLFEDANIKCLNYHRENNLLLEKLKSVQKKASETDKELKSIVASHASEITKLKEELEIERNLNQLRGGKSRDHQDGKCEDLQIEVEIAESQLISAQAENRRLQKDLERTFQELNQVKDDCEENFKIEIKNERERAQGALEQLDAAIQTQHQLRQDCQDLKVHVSELKSKLEASERRNSYYESEKGMNEFVRSYKVLESKSLDMTREVKQLVNDNNEKDDQIMLLLHRLQHLQKQLGSKADNPSDKELEGIIKVEKLGLNSKIKELETQLKTLEEERNALLKRLREYSGFIGVEKELVHNLSASQVAQVMDFINDLNSDKDDIGNKDMYSEMATEMSNLRAKHYSDQVAIQRLEREMKELKMKHSSDIEIGEIRSILDTIYQQNSKDKNICSTEKSDKATSPEHIRSNSDITKGEKYHEDYSNNHHKESILTIETPITSTVSVQVNSIEDVHPQVQTELQLTQAALYTCEKKLAKSESIIRRLRRSLDRFNERRDTNSSLLLAQSAIKELNEIVESKTQLLEKYRSQTNDSTPSASISINPDDYVRNSINKYFLDNENTIQQLRTTVTNSENQIKCLYCKLQDAAHVISILRSEKRTLMEQLEDQESFMQAKDNEIQDIKKKLRISNDRAQNLERSMSKAKASLSEKTNEISKLEQVESDLIKLKTNLSKLRRSNEKAMKNLHSANEQEAESQNKISTLEKEIDTLKLDLAILRNTNRNLTQKLKESSLKLKELHNISQPNPSEVADVGELKQKIICLQKDNAEIRGELSAFKLKASRDPVKFSSKENRDFKDVRIVNDNLKTENSKLLEKLSLVRQSVQKEYESTIDSLQAQVSYIKQVSRYLFGFISCTLITSSRF